MRAALIQATTTLKQAQRVLFDFDIANCFVYLVSGDSPSPNPPVVGDDISSVLRKIKADKWRTSSVLWNKLDPCIVCRKMINGNENVVRWDGRLIHTLDQMCIMEFVMIETSSRPTLKNVCIYNGHIRSDWSTPFGRITVSITKL